MNTSDIWPVLEEATVYTFKVMTSVDLLVGQSGPVSNMSLFYDMINSCITLDGGDFKGIMLLSIPPEALRKVLSIMLQEEKPNIEENISLSAEILNMIHGRMKTSIVQAGGKLAMARPRVLTGVEELESSHNGKARAVPFVLDESHGFFITIVAQEKVA